MDRAAISDNSEFTGTYQPSPERHLALLGEALQRAGWTTLLRRGGATPVLRVSASSVPGLGETVSAVRGPGPYACWYRSSTGSLLAPCAYPAEAAQTIATLLSPWVNAALAHHPRRERVAKTITWWGRHTRQWWAVIHDGSSHRLVAARTLDELARIIPQAHL